MSQAFPQKTALPLELIYDFLFFLAEQHGTRDHSVLPGMEPVSSAMEV